MGPKLARRRPPGRLAGLIHRIKEMTVEGAGLVLTLLPPRDHASQRLVGWKLAAGRASRRPQMDDELGLAPARVAFAPREARSPDDPAPGRALHTGKSQRLPLLEAPSGELK